MDRKLKITICNVGVDDMETWICSKKGEGKLPAAEIKFLRGIVGRTRRNGIKNTYIMGELMVEEMQN
jgi:hypothetical protein